MSKLKFGLKSPGQKLEDLEYDQFRVANAKADGIRLVLVHPFWAICGVVMAIAILLPLAMYLMGISERYFWSPEPTRITTSFELWELVTTQAELFPPTSTPTATPTATQLPPNTPASTATVTPTNTPEPTATLEPTLPFPLSVNCFVEDCEGYRKESEKFIQEWDGQMPVEASLTVSSMGAELTFRYTKGKGHFETSKGSWRDVCIGRNGIEYDCLAFSVAKPQ